MCLLMCPARVPGRKAEHLGVVGGPGGGNRRPVCAEGPRVRTEGRAGRSLELARGLSQQECVSGARSRGTVTWRVRGEQGGVGPVLMVGLLWAGRPVVLQPACSYPTPGKTPPGLNVIPSGSAGPSTHLGAGSLGAPWAAPAVGRVGRRGTPEVLFPPDPVQMASPSRPAPTAPPSPTSTCP